MPQERREQVRIVWRKDVSRLLSEYEYEPFWLYEMLRRFMLLTQRNAFQASGSDSIFEENRLVGSAMRCDNDSG